MNSRPYGPEPYALPNCATPRCIMMLIIFVRNVLPAFGSASRAHRRFCVSSLCPLTGVPFPLSVSFTYRNPNCATPRYIMMSIIFVRNVLPAFGSASRAHRRFCVSCSLSVDGCSLPAVRVASLSQPKLRYTPMYYDVDYLHQKLFDLKQITSLSYVDTANYISNIIFRCQENNLAAPSAICYLQSARQVVKYIRPIMIRRHYAIIQILQSHKGLFRT